MPPVFLGHLVRAVVCVAAVALTGLSAWGDTSVQSVLVKFTTEEGSFTVAVDAAHAPITAANFLRYVDGKFYDGGLVTRAVRADNTRRHDIPIQVVQFGINPARSKERFPPIALERTTATGIKHRNGTLSMARSTPGSAQAAWFICIGDQPQLDFGGKRNPDGQGFAAFGQVVSGLEVVLKLQSAPTGKQGEFGAETIDPPIRILSAARSAP